MTKYKELGLIVSLSVQIYVKLCVSLSLSVCVRKYDYPKKAPPSFYEVTNHSKERPDVWVQSPEKLV